MNTTEFIRQLAQQLNISQKQARQLLQQELSAIAEQLAAGNEVVIRGFGKFGLREPRKTRNNPSQGKRVSFRASPKFQQRIRRWRPE